MSVANNLPAAGMPVIGPDGRMVPVWFQFFMTLFARTGNEQGISVVDMQAELSGGTPVVDVDALSDTVYAIEAMAVQAMAVGALMDRIDELEARIDAQTQSAADLTDLDAQVAAGVPLFTALSQMTNDAAYLAVASTTTTAPSAGGAGALPATPKGYASVTINGASQQIPYY
jgi:hypothetical protein